MICGIHTSHALEVKEKTFWGGIKPFMPQSDLLVRIALGMCKIGTSRVRVYVRRKAIDCVFL